MSAVTVSVRTSCLTFNMIKNIAFGYVQIQIARALEN